MKNVINFCGRAGADVLVFALSLSISLAPGLAAGAQGTTGQNRVQSIADKCGFVGTEYDLGSLDKYGPVGEWYTSPSGHRVIKTLMPSRPKWEYSGPTVDTSKPTWLDPVSGSLVPGGFGSKLEFECYTGGITIESSQMYSYFKAIDYVIDKVTGSGSSNRSVSGSNTQTQSAASSQVGANSGAIEVGKLFGADLGLPRGSVITYNGASHAITDGPANQGCSTPTFTNTVPGKMYDSAIRQSLGKWSTETNHWQIQKRQQMMGNPLVASLPVPGVSPPDLAIPPGFTISETADGSTIIKFPPALVIPHHYSEAVANAVVDGKETGQAGCQDYALTHRNMTGTNRLDVTWEYFASVKGGAVSPNSCRYPNKGELRNKIIQQVVVVPSLKEYLESDAFKAEQAAEAAKTNANYDAFKRTAEGDAKSAAALASFEKSAEATAAANKESAQRLAEAEAEVAKAKDLEQRIRAEREAYYKDPANKEAIDKGIIIGTVPEFVKYQYTDLVAEIAKAEQVVRAIKYEIEHLPPGLKYQQHALDLITAEDELALAKENYPKNVKLMAETWNNPDYLKAAGLENSPWIEIHNRRMEEAVPNAEKKLARIKLALDHSLREDKIRHLQLSVADPNKRVIAEAVLAECPFTPLPDGTKWTVAEQKYTLPAGVTLASLEVTPTEPAVARLSDFGSGASSTTVQAGGGSNSPVMNDPVVAGAEVQTGGVASVASTLSGAPKGTAGQHKLTKAERKSQKAARKLAQREAKRSAKLAKQGGGSQGAKNAKDLSKRVNNLVADIKWDQNAGDINNEEAAALVAKADELKQKAEEAATPEEVAEVKEEVEAVKRELAEVKKNGRGQQVVIEMDGAVDLAKSDKKNKKKKEVQSAL